MTDYVKIPGLVTEQLSQNLADQLRKGYHYSIQQNGEYSLYVSENGSDDNEGTQEAPLRTVGKALIRASEIKTARLDKLFIKFLTDYHNSSEILYCCNPAVYLVIDGTGHEVELLGFFLSDGGRVQLNNLTISFLNNSREEALRVVLGANLELNNVNVVIRGGDKIKTVFQIGDNAQCFIRGSCTITNSSNKTLSEVFRVRDQAAFYGNADAVNISGKFNRVFFAYDAGDILHLNGDYTAADGTPSAFRVEGGSTIRLHGKGSEFVAGGTAGNTDDTAIIIPN